jgi:hypothetical protein
VSKINTKDAAKYLNERGIPITETTLNQLRKGGGPPFYKENGGKYIWYDTEDLDVWSPMKKSPKPMTKYNSTSEYRKKPE